VELARHTGMSLRDAQPIDIHQRRRRQRHLGKSGRAMLNALVAGTTDPEVLADRAKGKLRVKIPALEQAPEGNSRPITRS